MVFTVCCVSSCFSTTKRVKLFNFPRNDARRDVWVHRTAPYCPELRQMVPRQVVQRKICIKHFEATFIVNGVNRHKNAYPTLFTEEEINTGIPNSIAEFTGKCQPGGELQPVETPSLSNAVPADKLSFANKEVEKPAINLQVESSDGATIDATIYSDVAPEEIISDYEGEIDPVPAVLSNITCDNCSKTIVGFHYKCLICINYIHCHKCEMQEVHPNHYMIRMLKSPQPKVSEKIMEEMCNIFKTTYPISSAKDHQASVRNELAACDSDGDLSEEVKLLINKEVTRVKDKLVDKTNQVKTDNKKIKRKNILYHDTPKNRKMCIKTHTVNDETPSVVGTGRNDNIPNVSMNNETEVDHESRENNIWPDTIATVVTDPTSPGAVNMMLSDIVSQLIIEITRDGEKTTFKYVDT